MTQLTRIVVLCSLAVGFTACNSSNHGLVQCRSNGAVVEDISFCPGLAEGKACSAGIDCKSQKCLNGFCQGEPAVILTCDTGYDDCDDKASNGCETVLGTTANCAACGNACGKDTECKDAVCVGVIPPPADFTSQPDLLPPSVVDMGSTPDLTQPASPDLGSTPDLTPSPDLAPAPSCTDKVKNGSETDVDCGGTCSPCANGKGCIGGLDCLGGVCTNNKCIDATCADGVQNEKETGLDCGGPFCVPCDAGLACKVGMDCLSGICHDLVCKADACYDGVKNGYESDVDCGGYFCAACSDAKECRWYFDCKSYNCEAGRCVTPRCNDGVRNGSETDVDCGVACPAKCGDDKACDSARDCASGVCTNGVCEKYIPPTPPVTDMSLPPITSYTVEIVAPSAAEGWVFHTDVASSSAHYGPAPFTQVLTVAEVCGWGIEVAARQIVAGVPAGWYGCDSGTPSLNTLVVKINGVVMTGVLTKHLWACNGGGEGNLYFSKLALGCLA